MRGVTSISNCFAIETISFVGTPKTALDCKKKAKLLGIDITKSLTEITG